MSCSQIHLSPFSQASSPFDAAHFSDRWTKQFPKDIARRVYRELATADQGNFQRVCKIWNVYSKKARSNLKSLAKDFPDEVLSGIYSALSREDRNNFKLTCDRWNYAANQIEGELKAFSYPNNDYEISNHLPKLTELKVKSCELLDDQKIADIGKLKRLQLLKLDNPKALSGAGLTNLVGLTKLRVLELKSCPKLDDRSLESLKNLHSLESLNLCDCSEILGVGLTSLSKLERLNMLNISNCRAASDEGLKYIASLGKLKFLFLTESQANISAFKITKNGLIHLRQLNDLGALKLGNCKELTTGLIDQLTPLNKLRVLSLTGCQNLSEPELVNAILLPSIFILDLSHCRVTKEMLEIKQRFKFRCHLDVTGCQIENYDFEEYTRVINVHRTIGTLSIASLCLDWFSCDLKIEFDTIMARPEKRKDPRVKFVLRELVDSQVFGLIVACNGFFKTLAVNTYQPTFIAESPTLTMRIWRGIYRALREFNRLIMLALHLVGF